jgi:alkylation response protein AidB-like acyl-CoA dehydrogenase
LSTRKEVWVTVTYVLTEEHELLRQTVRELAEAKIAPFPADVDATGRFPQEAPDALTGTGLHAPHIPEAHGGEGADALATVIVIEEVARVCAASSLIPAVKKLGTVPLLLAGSEELKHTYLPPVARGDAMFSYAQSEAGAGSDAASMRTRAVRDGDDWVLNGTKMWIRHAGMSDYYTVLAARLRQAARAVRPTGRPLPGRAVHARRHGDETRGSTPAHIQRRGLVRTSHARRQGPGPHVHVRGG